MMWTSSLQCQSPAPCTPTTQHHPWCMTSLRFSTSYTWKKALPGNIIQAAIRFSCLYVIGTKKQMSSIYISRRQTRSHSIKLLQMSRVPRLCSSFSVRAAGNTGIVTEQSKSQEILGFYLPALTGMHHRHLSQSLGFFNTLVVRPSVTQFHRPLLKILERISKTSYVHKKSS